MDPALVAAIIFVVATGAILAYVWLYGWSSAHRKINRSRAEGRASVPYYHSPEELEDERGVHEQEHRPTA